ncbi:GATA transcription factor 11-like [Gossypium australe]|uniref:GATA transcription factor 11-like n=1 Tax=Gossypium australe TaxID=47621 RepID=A0A5B6WUX0_9ROSI|nr:GATA transcription factor 11-like [Gossypium australe]
MNKPWFEKTFNGVNDDLFDDDVMEYLDLPLDDVERIDGGVSGNVIKDFGFPLYDNNGDYGGGGFSGGEEWDCNFQHLAGFCGGDFLDDSIVESLTFSQSSSTKVSYSKSMDVKSSSWFQTSSPVSVLDRRSSSSGANRIPINPNLSFQGKRCRTNRRRASTLNSPFTLPLVFSTFSTSQRFYFPVGSKSESVSHLTQKPTRKRLKKKNLKLLSGSSESNKSSSQQLVIRKCAHCEVTETPQWREGPMGPKTLCNACGTRYRSDRLFPEYRPAGSPTFIPSLHSKSHKKVVEMRRKSQFADDSNNIRVVNPTETSLRYQLY